MTKTRLSPAARWFFALGLALALAGCASLGGPRPVAVVNGEPISDQELVRSLQRLHTAEPQETPAKIDIKEFIQRAVDEKLMLQDARRMGLFERPEVERGVRAYLVREAVGRLYRDEIANKVTVSEAELRKEFFDDYDEIGMIVLNFLYRGQAEEAARQLRSGAELAKVAADYGFAKVPRETFVRRALSGDEFAPAFKLKPGEIFGPVRKSGHFLVARITSHRPALAEEFAQFRDAIERPILKLREKKRSDAYLLELAAKYPHHVDQDVLASIPTTLPELAKLEGDERVVARVGEVTLSVAEVAKDLRQAAELPMGGVSLEEGKGNVVKAWVNERLVDAEALSRHYEQQDPLLAKELDAYRNDLAVRLYTSMVLVPQVHIDEAALQAYYEAHQQDYLKPQRLKLRQLSFENKEKADWALGELNKGADFAWLARTCSVDGFADKGGQLGWVTSDQVNQEVLSALSGLEVGHLSEVLHLGSRYEILRLEGRDPQEVWPFEHVRRQVAADLYRSELERVRGEAAQKLSAGARIEVDDGAVARLRQRFFPAGAKAN